MPELLSVVLMNCAIEDTNTASKTLQETAIFKPMKNVRAILKTTGVVILTLAIYFWYFTGYLFLKMRRRSTELWRNKNLRRWGKYSAAILSLNISVKGDPPSPPFLLVCNHLTYLDIIVCYATLDTTIISKAEVKSWPVMGFIAKTIGVVFIDRTRKKDIARVIDAISININERQGITFYPEGTTSSGEGVKRFKPSLLQPAAEGGIPVSAAAIKYRSNDEHASTKNEVHWWGDDLMFAHFFNFAKLKKTDAEIRFSNKTFINSDRKKLAEELHNEVSRLFDTPIGGFKTSSIEYQQ